MLALALRFMILDVHYPGPPGGAPSPPGTGAHSKTVTASYAILQPTVLLVQHTCLRKQDH